MAQGHADSAAIGRDLTPSLLLTTLLVAALAVAVAVAAALATI